MGGPYTSVCTWLLETCTWEPENYNMVLNALFGHSHINAHYRSILLRPSIHLSLPEWFMDTLWDFGGCGLGSFSLPLCNWWLKMCTWEPKMTSAVFQKFMPAMEHPNTDLYPWGDPIHPCAPGYWKRAPGNPKIIILSQMHLPVFLIFMPTIGASYYGPLSMGALPEWFMDTLWDFDGCGLGSLCTWESEKLKHGPKCTCRCSWYSCPIWSTPTRTSIHGGTLYIRAPGYWKRAPGNPKMTYCPVTMLGYMAVHQNVNKSKSTHPIWMGFFLN